MLTYILMILLVFITIQTLVKFLILWPFVPYEMRMARIRSYYAKRHRIISWYDTVALLIVIAMVVLLFVTDLHALSFITGLTVGMLTLQVYFHRYIEPLPPEKMPEQPISPVKLMSYAIQARPFAAWREIAIISVLSAWALYELTTRLLVG